MHADNPLARFVFRRRTPSTCTLPYSVRYTIYYTVASSGWIFFRLPLTSSTLQCNSTTRRELGREIEDPRALERKTLTGSSYPRGSHIKWWEKLWYTQTLIEIPQRCAKFIQFITGTIPNYIKKYLIQSQYTICSLHIFILHNKNS